MNFINRFPLNVHFQSLVSVEEVSIIVQIFHVFLQYSSKLQVKNFYGIIISESERDNNLITFQPNLIKRSVFRYEMQRVELFYGESRTALQGHHRLCGWRYILRLLP